ncbi:D-aminoacyl-tRNA deacylase [Botrimarina hoheduenensis]|uniref:D-aminoacyl-tRNA deacylase n=1 Tax=Botrimarina hoheduenensis TaxID=2528000 RepID=A0A5C5VUF9_9BACT|nr:D-aminoacyl-tRNA deacylase [Botrimarina hoheduenensis]TWT41555.1 D-tyrosyl-tRNA(Tyr) deacylase [Botrimarina hoheduenensis]
MRSVVQRVTSARVTVSEEVVGEIGPGLLVLLGVAEADGDREITWMAEKLVGLRIFDDPQGKMNLSLLDTGGEMLVVSQFTLLADCRKGKRPSYLGAAPPELAEPLYEQFVAAVRTRGVRVATGQFRTEMHVSLVNHGPVTIIVDTPTG